MSKIQSVKSMIFNNKKVIENYVFMTILQLLNSFFYLLIYPYLIRVLGNENYGTFVFATSVVSYFSLFINFGLGMPGVKSIAESKDDIKKQSDTVSCIFTAQTYLFFISVVLFCIMLYTIPVFKANYWVFIWCFLLVYSNVLFPRWYFQGIQNMKVITYINLAFKIISLPFIIFFVEEKDDLEVYAMIVSMSTLLGAFIAFRMLYWKYGLRVEWVRISRLRVWFKDGAPFFFSHLSGYFKEYSTPIIIGMFFGMKEVAIYDLAYRVVFVPKTLFMNVNVAIFPKLITANIQPRLVKKIIGAEVFASLVVMGMIIVFGRWIIQIMGGDMMMDSYYLSVLLSITILVSMVVGAYNNFVFIPKGKYYFITVNQILSLTSFLIFTLLGLFIYRDILVFGGVIAISGLLEIVYCKFMAKKCRV